jgi:hypothetical protein
MQMHEQGRRTAEVDRSAHQQAQRMMAKRLDQWGHVSLLRDSKKRYEKMIINRN